MSEGSNILSNANLKNNQKNTTSENSNSSSNNTKVTDKQIVSINDIKNRVCYFSLAGDLAIHAIKEYYNCNDDELKMIIEERLFFAIIMFDVVILHCSDPLRNKLIKEILKNHILWIEEGRIRFIAADDIDDWKKDYNKYIDRKICEYKDKKKGFHADLEAESLTQSFITPDYKNEVIEILAKSSFYIRKDEEPANQFPKLLINDLKHQHQSERLVISLYNEEDHDFSNIKQYAIEKTVSQLLYAKYLSDDQCSNSNNNQAQLICEDVFERETVDGIIKDIKKAIRTKKVVPRSAIVGSIEEKIEKKKLTEIQEALLSAVTLRMDLMYCRMNAGNQIILEFHPSYEQQTLYQIECFNIYISKFHSNMNLKNISVDAINNLLADRDAITLFRSGFLSAMADTHEQKNIRLKLGDYIDNFTENCHRVLEAYDGLFNECKNCNFREYIKSLFNKKELI